MTDYFLCSSNNVLLPGADKPQKATIIVEISSGKIIDIRTTLPTSLEQLTNEFAPKSVNWLNAEHKLVLPGLVDAHVHLNEPGRTAWEGFYTGTRAALSGGITTLVDMPLNSLPPTTTTLNLEAKKQAARGQCYTDVAFWGGVIPGNHNDLRPLLKEGVRGFKCFLMESGVDEFPCITEPDLRLAMEQLQGQDTVLLFHAELEDAKTEHNDTVSDPCKYSTFLASRPQELEVNAITLIIKLLKEFPKLRCHIVHLSAAAAIPLIREARAEGLPLTVETCFHYLCLASEDIPSGHAEFKCCPPVREDSNRDLLWDALKEGIIDFVVSDHSPCTLDLKRLDDGNLMSAWGGISTLGLGLSLLWTEGQKRGVGINQIIQWTSKNTANHAGLGSSKGELAVGYDGDIIVWDPKCNFEVTKELLQFKNKISPYEGMTLNGRVEKVFLRGQRVFEQDTGFQDPIGQLL